jgi:hypothetical protein
MLHGPHANEGLPRLEGGKFGKSGGMVAKLLVLLEREEAPVVLHPAVYTAILFVSNAIELFGVGHGQRLQ